MMSDLKDVLNDSSICYQDLSENVGLWRRIKKGFMVSTQKHSKTLMNFNLI